MAKGKVVTGKKTKTLPRGGSVNVYAANGKVDGKIDLPPVFRTPFRPDIIRRSVVSAQANRKQRYAPSPTAGMRHAVSTWGKGRGVARVQRLSQGRRAAESPNNVGGRRAHPPRLEHSPRKKMNSKERIFARESALAATSKEEIVRSRGHRFKEGLTLPVVVNDDLEKLERSRDIRYLLSNLGLEDDLIRAKDGIHIRAGRGKMRGRRYRKPRSILVVASEGSPVLKGARNIPGINTASPRSLNSEMLAPGGDPGRLMVISSKALKEMGGASE